MQIVMIGSGYVGLVSGTCFAEFGHNVVCIDSNAAVIENLQAGIIPIFEPGLDTLVTRNISAGRLRFSTDTASAVAVANAVFIAVGTPSRRGDGHADLTHVYAAAREIAAAAPDDCVIVDKSTVPVGTAREVEAICREVAPHKQLSVASNPEFLREGSAIEDFMRPDRVICGVDDPKAESVLRAIYRPLSLRETPLVFTDRETAEVIKYAANAFLAIKISFINEISDLCEAVGANVQDVAKGIGLDKRIGSKFLHPGPGYGGSCFPKDTLALLQTARSNGVPLKIVTAATEVNNTRKGEMVERVIRLCGGSVAGKKIAVLGVTFKPNTDDMREAPSLMMIPAWQAAGAQISAFDPQGRGHADQYFSQVNWANDPYEAIVGADAAVLLTEWNELRALDLAKVKAQLKSPLFIDLRNVYPPEDMRSAGLQYHSIGRPYRDAGARSLPA
ncbi:UDP-glucose dehydrogenase family protein [Sphingosinicella microcystinivorans]|uniref:UDP-glucose 6-dehydrogenase n=1 Tax=Sphingosinicella microcystinivorans TaxID=335406 RepID=A0AAD1G0I8_SPHMI|nr:UDP-glucose/GDP-mannose dehydrogenase family protein [Sphingosinicella microcystinivorans]RKS90877.1 UDP-glucose dehydrogenase [Sphingosinicella microcystinivorans]BBE33793.1 UDP-glucose 6-dehydrogenase [Sphingosinicella microcystinivorans]